MLNEKLETLIKNYAEAVDKQDIVKASNFMEPEFRVIMKNNKNKKLRTIISRSEYLELMKEKKVGGSDRSLKLHSTFMYAGFAYAFLELENEKMHMDSSYIFVEQSDEWKLLQDTLFITFKN